MKNSKETMDQYQKHKKVLEVKGTRFLLKKLVRLLQVQMMNAIS